MTLHRAVDRASALYEREVALRDHARLLELNPARAKEARELFSRATKARRIRLALLRRWRLV